MLATYEKEALVHEKRAMQYPLLAGGVARTASTGNPLGPVTHKQIGTVFQSDTRSRIVREFIPEETLQQL